MYRMDTSMGVPLYVAKENEKINPEKVREDTAFVIGSNGMFVKRSNPLYSGLFKVSKPPVFLGEVVEEITQHLELKIPVHLFRGIEAFFADIFAEHQTEVAVILYYSFATEKWAYCVPQQTVSGSSVHYDIANGATYVHEDDLGNGRDSLPKKDGFVQVGSIHSHASMSAFHSGIDDKDEFNFDGIHITIGNFNADMRTYSCRLIFGEKQIKKEVGEVVDCPTIAGVRPKTLKERVAKYAPPEKATITAPYSTWKDEKEWNGGFQQYRNYCSGKKSVGYSAPSAAKKEEDTQQDAGYQFNYGIVIHGDEAYTGEE